jgi:predicted dehydrogenase
MIKASNKHRVKLCVVHNALFNPIFMKARSLAEEGSLGDILGVDIKWVGWAPHADLDKHPSWVLDIPGGVFGEALPHPVYLQLALLGQIRDVYVISKHLKHWPIPDELRVILDGGNSIGTITMSLNMPRTLGTVEIFGTKMTVFCDLWNPTMTRHKPRKDDYLSLALDNLSSCTQMLSSTVLTSLKKLFGKLHSGHEILIPKIIESISNNKDPPVSEKEGREVVRIVERISNQIQVYR